MKSRPIGVTILAILAGALAVLGALRVLQFLAIIPFFFGPLVFRSFNLWAALMWGLMVWVYAWLTKMLWDVDPSAWLFLAVITVFNLILDFIVLVGGGAWGDVALTMIINALVLIYVMLPGTRAAFGTQTK
jgi:hypothetical protein